MKRTLTILAIVLLALPAFAANEIEFLYPSGSSLYALIRRPADSKVWNATTVAWATWSDASVKDYNVPLTDHSGGYYSGTFPATTAGSYTVGVYVRAGSNPATSDGIVGLGPVVWTGTAARTLASAKMDTDGLDSVSTTYPTGVASNFREMLVQTWLRFFGKTAMTATAVTTYAANGTTVLTTQAVSDNGTIQTQGAAH
jgi:hypothetical protein